MGKGGQQPPRIHHGTSKDEQRAALQAFAAMDIDGDGELTAEEIYKALSKHDAAITMERVRELVARADVDKNGTVSRDEYLSAVASGENWTKSLRDFIGHDAEHQAAHRVAEKAGFAITEQGLHVGEALATRFTEDVAAAAPRKRASSAGAPATAAAAIQSGARRAAHACRLLGAAGRRAGVWGVVAGSFNTPRS